MGLVLQKNLVSKIKARLLDNLSSKWIDLYTRQAIEQMRQRLVH